MDAYDVYMKRYAEIDEKLQELGLLVAGHKNQVDFEKECNWGHANELAKVVADLNETIEFMQD